MKLAAFIAAFIAGFLLFTAAIIIVTLKVERARQEKRAALRHEVMTIAAYWSQDGSLLLVSNSTPTSVWLTNIPARLIHK